MEHTHPTNEELALKLIPGIARTLAMQHYVDSVGRSDVYAVPASWWLEEMKTDTAIAKVTFADELIAALADPEIGSVLLIKPHHITKAQLYHLLKASSLGTTIFEEV